jgi:hypothetical protein
MLLLDRRLPIQQKTVSLCVSVVNLKLKLHQFQSMFK